MTYLWWTSFYFNWRYLQDLLVNGWSGTLSIDNFGGVSRGIHSLPQGTALVTRDIRATETQTHNIDTVILAPCTYIYRSQLTKPFCD